MNITKLSSGTWRARVYAGVENGKSVYKSITGATRKEVEIKAAQFQMQQAEKKKAMAKPQSQQMTVGEAIDRYIENLIGVLSPTTIRRYQTDRKKFFKPIMGIKLFELTQDDIQKAVSIDSKRYAAKSIHCAHGLLSAALGVYLSDFHLKTNLPQKVISEVIVPENADVQRMLDHVRGTRMEGAILLGACCGLRRSEICGLKYSDIDVEKSQIKVRRTIVKDEHGKWIVRDNTKTPKSKREFEVAPFIIQRLLELPREGEFVINRMPDTISKEFIDVRNTLGLTCRFHDLRHYNASIMLALNIPDKYAMERMGYATPATLKKVYQHTMRDKQKEVADTINGQMNTLFAGN